MLNRRAMPNRAELSQPKQSLPIAPAPAGARPPSTFSLLVRLARDYLSGETGTLVLAMIAMIVTSVMTMALAYIVQPTIRELFLNKNGRMLLVIPLAACGILIVRAASFYAQQTLVGSLGERIVAATQRDMFDSLIRRDLESLNE